MKETVISFLEEEIEFATNLIIESYSLDKAEAHSLALKALRGIDSHGLDTSSREAIKEVVSVVVASWLEKP